MHYETKWKHSRHAVCWFRFPKAQEKGLTFWQTRSHATTVHDSVPPDCIKKEISEKGDKTLYQRLTTLRPAPRQIFKNAWNQQQHQQQQAIFGSSWKQEQARHQGGRNSDYEGNTWKHPAKEEDSFQVDHRTQGISQDAKNKDLERMTETQTLVDKLQAG